VDGGGGSADEEDGAINPSDRALWLGRFSIVSTVDQLSSPLLGYMIIMVEQIIIKALLFAASTKTSVVWCDELAVSDNNGVTELLPRKALSLLVILFRASPIYMYCCLSVPLSS